jgi:hypothetical protein
MSLPSVVRESCVVAVDMYEVRLSYPFPLPVSLAWRLTRDVPAFAGHQYETSGQFQYADALGSGEKAIGGGTGFERSVGVEAI